MSKTLKKWNGRASGHKRGTFYVAAYTQKQAAELISRAAGYRDGDMRGALGEIQSYYSPVWGNPMDGIEPTEPCVYHSERHEKPVRVYPTDAMYVARCKAFFQSAPFATKVYVAMQTGVGLDFIKEHWSEISNS